MSQTEDDDMRRRAVEVSNTPIHQPVVRIARATVPLRTMFRDFVDGKGVDPGPARDVVATELIERVLGESSGMSTGNVRFTIIAEWP
jgi:hypothetical protein